MRSIRTPRRPNNPKEMYYIDVDQARDSAQNDPTAGFQRLFEHSPSPLHTTSWFNGPSYRIITQPAADQVSRQENSSDPQQPTKDVEVIELSDSEDELFTAQNAQTAGFPGRPRHSLPNNPSNTWISPAERVAATILGKNLVGSDRESARQVLTIPDNFTDATGGVHEPAEAGNPNAFPRFGEIRSLDFNNRDPTPITQRIHQHSRSQSVTRGSIDLTADHEEIAKAEITQQASLALSFGSAHQSDSQSSASSINQAGFQASQSHLVSVSPLSEASHVQNQSQSRDEDAPNLRHNTAETAKEAESSGVRKAPKLLSRTSNLGHEATNAAGDLPTRVPARKWPDELNISDGKQTQVTDTCTDQQHSAHVSPNDGRSDGLRMPDEDRITAVPLVREHSNHFGKPVDDSATGLVLDDTSPETILGDIDDNQLLPQADAPDEDYAQRYENLQDAEPQRLQKESEAKAKKKEEARLNLAKFYAARDAESQRCRERRAEFRNEKENTKRLTASQSASLTPDDGGRRQQESSAVAVGGVRSKQKPTHAVDRDGAFAKMAEVKPPTTSIIQIADQIVSNAFENDECRSQANKEALKEVLQARKEAGIGQSSNQYGLADQLSEDRPYLQQRFERGAEPPTERVIRKLRKEDSIDQAALNGYLPRQKSSISTSEKSNSTAQSTTTESPCWQATAQNGKSDKTGGSKAGEKEMEMHKHYLIQGLREAESKKRRANQLSFNEIEKLDMTPKKRKFDHWEKPDVLTQAYWQGFRPPHDLKTHDDKCAGATSNHLSRRGRARSEEPRLFGPIYDMNRGFDRPLLGLPALAASRPCVVSEETDAGSMMGKSTQTKGGKRFRDRTKEKAKQKERYHSDPVYRANMLARRREAEKRRREARLKNGNSSAKAVLSGEAAAGNLSDTNLPRQQKRQPQYAARYAHLSPEDRKLVISENSRKARKEQEQKKLEDVQRQLDLFNQRSAGAHHEQQMENGCHPNEAGDDPTGDQSLFFTDGEVSSSSSDEDENVEQRQQRKARKIEERARQRRARQRQQQQEEERQQKERREQAQMKDQVSFLQPDTVSRGTSTDRVTLPETPVTQERPTFGGKAITPVTSPTRSNTSPDRDILTKTLRHSVPITGDSRPNVNADTYATELFEADDDEEEEELFEYYINRTEWLAIEDEDSADSHVFGPFFTISEANKQAFRLILSSADHSDDSDDEYDDITRVTIGWASSTTHSIDALGMKSFLITAYNGFIRSHVTRRRTPKRRVTKRIRKAMRIPRMVWIVMRSEFTIYEDTLTQRGMPNTVLATESADGGDCSRPPQTQSQTPLQPREPTYSCTLLGTYSVREDANIAAGRELQRLHIKSLSARVDLDISINADSDSDVDTDSSEDNESDSEFSPSQIIARCRARAERLAYRKDFRAQIAAIRKQIRDAVSTINAMKHEDKVYPIIGEDGSHFTDAVMEGEVEGYTGGAGAIDYVGRKGIGKVRVWVQGQAVQGPRN
ncbi:hypothetical protein MMC25_004218 [Agyrium rufum]|nr:hypothetical protein [Agyrium rufum]